MEFTRNFKNLSKTDVGEAGGKGASLGEMTKAGIPVPPGFVVLASAFERFIEETDINVELDSILDNVDHKRVDTVEHASEKIQALVLAAKMPKDIAADVRKEFKKLGAKFVAVRSSATAEDSSAAAWAGQLDSFLNTTEKTLLQNVQRCWASLFTPRAIFYRFEKNLHKQKISVAVVVQKMVESEVSGIAFSVHPVTEDRNQLIIEAGFGLGEAIVSGQITPDSYVVEKEPRRIIDKNISVQNRALYRGKTGGVDWSELAEKEGAKQALSDKEILQLTELILKIERHYGFPCDIEWAREKGKFYVVQSRPITTLGNIIVEQSPTTEQNTIIEQVISMYQTYRDDIVRFNYPSLIFYVCLSWYWITEQSKKYFGRTVPFILLFAKDGAGNFETPFYMGPAEVVMEQIESQGLMWIKKSKQKITMAKKSLYTWIKTHPVKTGLRLPEYVIGLQKFLNIFLDAHIHFQISSQIDKPLNRKLTKIFHESGNDLSEKKIFELCISDEKSDVFSHEEKIAKLRMWCKKNNMTPSEGQYDLYIKNKEFKKRLQKCYNTGYFLHSGYGGVKFWTMRDEYGLLWETKTKVLHKRNCQPLLTAEQHLWVSAAKHFLTMRDARKSLQQRSFYYFAQILEELARLTGISRSDLEYLRIEEFNEKSFRNIENLKKIISERKAGYLSIWEPKLGTHTWSGNNAIEKYEAIATKFKQVNELLGQCTSPGVARGRVRIVFNPRLQKDFHRDEILVTGMTSPDFVPLMKKAAAIVTELGGITCHAAIISRELKKPCIIGTKIATQVLKDGDLVEVDAEHGTVKILKKAMRDPEYSEGTGKGVARILKKA